MEVYERNIWDQSLTYGHFNLHNRSLVNDPLGGHASFLDYCEAQQISVLAAAPLSMGLLTRRGPPQWHPASDELKDACSKAAHICRKHDVDIATLALVVALSQPDIPCTILGMGTVEEVKRNCSVARRLQGVKSSKQEEILKEVLSLDEMKAWEELKDATKSPFARVWKNGNYKWDGIKEAHDFWKQLDNKRVVNWHVSAP